MSMGSAVVQMEEVQRMRGGRSQGFRIEVTSLTINAGECFALIGPSGSGKTTMLDLLGLVLRPDIAGSFWFRDRNGTPVDVRSLWQCCRLDRLADLRASNIGYVLQTGGLLPFLSARQNIELSRRLLALRNDGMVSHLVKRLELTRLLDKMPKALSIGERQRVAIARALAHRPILLLADEPTAALDPRQGVEVMRLLLQLASELEMAAIIVSHEWDVVRSLGLREVEARLGAAEEGVVAARFGHD